jgi:cell division protease FtsH
MQKHYKFSLWYVILGIWVVLIIQNYIASMYAAQIIPYSQFLSLLKAGKVTEIAISANQIQGKMKIDGTPGDLKPFKTVRVDPELSNMLAQYPVSFKGEIESTFLRDLFSWIFPLLLFVGVWFFLMKRMGGQQAGFMTLGKNKAKIYMENELNVTFADAAGVDEAKQELVEVIEFLKTPGKFTDIGGRIPKGILLVGPPGSGKTLLAKAVAGESGVPFFSLSGSEFVEMFVGLGAARVRDLFVQAKGKAPCIIFIDELDAIGKSRAQMLSTNDEREQTLNQLLVEMDGFDARTGVIILAATNRPEVLDPALLRPGRFDRQVLMDKPDLNGREAILRIHSRGVRLDDSVSLRDVAKRTPGFVGADLANLVNEAAILAVRAGRQKVAQADFDTAFEKLVAGLEKKNRLINPKERRIVAYHETGHALVAYFTPGADPVEKISIVPRGIAALGYTLQLPTEDRYLMTKGELDGRIDVLLGGRAAEQLVFHEVSTGASNDLDKAGEIARRMITDFGMSDKFRNTFLPARRQGQLMGVSANEMMMREYSEATQQYVDEETARIINGRFERVAKLLAGKESLLREIAEKLIEVEVLEKEQFESAVRGAVQPEPVAAKEGQP